MGAWGCECIQPLFCSVLLVVLRGGANGRGRGVPSEDLCCSYSYFDRLLFIIVTKLFRMLITVIYAGLRRGSVIRRFMYS
ncbi:hypothetical protein BDR06DRAFT_953068, partial [Suillus hirtellus]